MKIKESFKLVLVRVKSQQIILYDPLAVEGGENISTNLSLGYVVEFLRQDY